MNGWFKFHRKIFENPICNKDSEYFHVWCWILANAEFEEKRVLFGGEDIVLQKGQMITTSKEIAQSLNINESKVRRILKSLENAKQIDRQTSTRNSLITVVNWHLYQNSDGQNDELVTDKWQTTDGQVTDKRQTSGEPSYYIKNKRMEEKEEDKKEEIVSPVSEFSNCSDIQSILTAWNELERYGIKAVTKLKSTTKRYNWLSARIKEYSVDDVLTAIENIKQSDFLQGKNNRGWVITFDWFVRPNNFPKVLDGNYSKNDMQTERKSYVGNSRDEQFQRLMEQIRRDEENANRG